MGGFFGQLLQGYGENIIQKQKTDMDESQLEQQQQKVAMGKMQMLQAQQKQQSTKDISMFMKATQDNDASTVNDPIKTAQMYEGAAAVAVRDGNFQGAEELNNLAKSKRKDSTNAQIEVANKIASAKEDFSEAASNYSRTPTPEMENNLMRKALAAGINPSSLPAPGSPGILAFAKNAETASMSGKERAAFYEKQNEFNQNKEIQKQNHADEQANRSAQMQQTAMFQAGLRDDRRQAREDKIQNIEKRKEEKSSGSSMTAQQSGVNNQVITASTEATRSLIAMGRENLGVTVGTYSDLHNNTLSSATVKALTTNITTDEQRNMAVKSGGAALEMARALTLGAGKSANNAQIEEIKKMITPVVGDSKWNALIKQANAIEILKVRAETTPESRDPKVRAAQIENEKILNSYPSLIQVENAMKKQGLGREFKNEQGNFNNKLSRIKEDINKNPQETKSGHPADIDAILAKNKR